MDTPERGGPAIGWEVLQANPALLQPGDVVHMRWPGFPWNLVRLLTRNKGEGPTWPNHTAIIGSNEPVALLIEAMVRAVIRQPNRYQHPPWWTLWRGPFRLVVHRRLGGMSPEVREAIAAKALDYQGRSFGVGKLLLHALDFICGGAYFFRRFARMDDYPICSWIVAYAYYRIIGLKFDVEPNAASPDDIMDYCVRHKWRLIWVDSPATRGEFYRFYPKARLAP